MADALKLRRRVARAAVFAVGGGVALTFMFAVPAMAQDVVVQDATVVNGGAAAANSGGNVAVGNNSTNGSANVQGAAGFLGSNVSSGGGNTSNGTASVVTGPATAVGNDSTTGVAQSADTGGPGPGVDVVVQDADVINAGGALANSGGNVAVGNNSTNGSLNAQGAIGGVASNVGGGGNTSNGTATIATGAATAVGNSSDTGISQAAATGPDGLAPGLDVVIQDSDVINIGLAVANSGGNLAVGNNSFNLDLNLQGAVGLVASNVGGAGNSSNGTAAILTGPATAVGNDSVTGVDQAANTGSGPGLNLVFQDPFILNAGFALANSGINGAVGNNSFNLALNVQLAAGLIASNVNDAVGNTSNGNAGVATGAANAAGNRAITAVRQRLA
jgi:hypothetical protein